MTNEEMLAKIKIKLIKDPVKLGQQVEQQVETPSMLRRVITDASFIIAMRGIAGVGKGIKVNPNRITRRVVRGKPVPEPQRDISRIPTHEELTHRTPIKLPSTSRHIDSALREARVERMRSKIRSVASSPKRKKLQRRIAHRSIDSAMRDVRIERMRSEIRSVASKSKRQKIQRRTQLVSQRNELVQQKEKLELVQQQKMQLGRRLGGVTSSRNKYRELAGERQRTQADYELGVQSLHSMAMSKRMGFDVQTTDEQVRAIQQQAMDNLKRQYEDQLVPVRVTVPVKQNTRYMEATR